MITAGEFKKGVVITFQGAPWIVEDYHIQKTAQRRPVLQTRLRNMKTGQVVERSFDEAEKFEQPEVQTRTFQFLYQDASGYVFMDTETFDQLTVPESVVGPGKWLIKEGDQIAIRLLDGQPIQLDLPPTFTDEVVETAEPISQSQVGHVMKEARLACGLVVKVPLFIKVGDRIRLDTETHKYLGKESGKH